MSLELPDGLRGVVLIGHDGTTYRVIGTNTDGYLVALMTGTDGSSLVTIKTDSAGNLVAVMTGEYSGSLKTIATDASGQIIAILKGASGYNLAIDSDGYLTTVIKGDYGGTLKTVALDGEGRLSAFVIDSQDAWGELLAVGNAELAVRLGSPKFFDRRGAVSFLDDFSAGLGKWKQETVGTGADIALDPTRMVTGGYSCKLVGGSDSFRYASITMYTPITPAIAYGVEVGVSFGGTTGYFQIQMVYRDGTNKHTASVRFDSVNDNLDVYKSDGTWETFASSPLLYHSSYCFLHFKMVFDVDADTYLRFIEGGQQYDLSSYALKTAAEATGVYALVAITNTSRSGQNDDVYVDRVVITNSEPAN